MGVVVSRNYGRWKEVGNAEAIGAEIVEVPIWGSIRAIAFDKNMEYEIETVEGHSGPESIVYQREFKGEKETLHNARNNE